MTNPPFAEWAKLRNHAMQPPWYKEWLNWVLIVTYICIMILAIWMLLNDPYPEDELGGGHDHMPFPGTERTLPC